MPAAELSEGWGLVEVRRAQEKSSRRSWRAQSVACSRTHFVARKGSIADAAPTRPEGREETWFVKRLST